MYDPLYNPYLDCPHGLGGFRCRDCGRVTRTEAGMKAHCWRVHGKKAQRDFTFTSELVRSGAGDMSPAIADGKQRNAGAASGGGEALTASAPKDSSSDDPALP